MVSITLARQFIKREYLNFNAIEPDLEQKGDIRQETVGNQR